MLAGDPYGAGNVDGTGTAAAFHGPYGITTDNEGNLYVTDSMNNTVRKITPAGVVTTLAGTAGVTGSADGQGAAAQFNAPGATAIDATGNLYVSDSAGIRKITPDGTVTTLPGTAGAATDGIAVDQTGNIFVSNIGLDAILKITPAGVVMTFAGGSGAGLVDGTGTAAMLQEPKGLTIDSDGNLFVADWGNSAIRKITSAAVVTTVARFSPPVYPEGIAVDSTGNLYVSNNYTEFVILKIAPAGSVTTLAGTASASGNADGTGAAATFTSPEGIAIDRAGLLYVADTGNNDIRKITPAGVVTTFAGGYRRGAADGAGTVAQFNSPDGLATDVEGNIYAIDSGNAAIRKITPAGSVTTRAKLPGAALHSSDDYGSGIAINSAGVVYFVEVTSEIQQIGPLFASMAVTLRNSAGLTLLLSSCSNVNTPCTFAADVTTDASGNAYFTGDQTINKVDPAGNITIMAGATGAAGSADGTGTIARFNGLAGIAADGVGNLYVTDAGNNTIRKITPGGVVTTLAGTAGVTGSKDGMGASAEFNHPAGIVIDEIGNVYVADTLNNSIRKLTAGGMVSTIAGQPGRMGFTSGELPGALSQPLGLALFGRILYTTCNNAIVQVTNVP